MKNPRLRSDIQMVASTLEGRRVITFHDPLQLGGRTVAVDMALLPLLELLDGRHDVRDIQMEMMSRQGGRLIFQTEIESFLNQLDRIFLLDSDLFRQRMQKIREEFGNQSKRDFVHGGKCYDTDPVRLSRFIEEIERTLPPDDGQDLKHICGILSPHIDIQVAQRTYVGTYRLLKGRSYDLVIILGVNHNPQDGLYSLSEKNYLTPYGELPADRDLVRDLREKLPKGTLSSDDFGHKMEHSIEFQTLFIHHYLKNSTPIVPILCGSLHEFILGGENLFGDERYQAMLAALRDVIREKEGKVLCVAGVDFAHVGLKFGDTLPADALLPRTRSNDERILSCILNGETEKIFQNAVETKDQYKVCGLPAIVLLCDLLRGSHRRVMAYETYDEAMTQSAVTYASVLFCGQ
jgi:AmmeMemoRadiSam system protein B